MITPYAIPLYRGVVIIALIDNVISHAVPSKHYYIINRVGGVSNVIFGSNVIGF